MSGELAFHIVLWSIAYGVAFAETLLVAAWGSRHGAIYIRA